MKALSETQHRSPYRLTPTTNVHLPSVPATWFPAVSRGKWIRYDWTCGSEERNIDVDFVVRELFDVDLDDPAVLLGVLNAYGVIDSQFTLPVIKTKLLPPEPPRGFAIHINDVSLHLRAIRAAVRHRIAIDADDDVVDAWTGEGFATDEPGAWLKVRSVLNQAGANLVRMDLEVARQEKNAMPLVFDERPTSLVSVLADQLWNLYVDNLPFLTCENENCQATFTRQRGRSAMGHYRTENVMYCSANCSKAASKRRRRQAQRSLNGGTQA